MSNGKEKSVEDLRELIDPFLKQMSTVFICRSFMDKLKLEECLEELERLLKVEKDLQGFLDDLNMPTHSLIGVPNELMRYTKETVEKLNDRIANYKE